MVCMDLFIAGSQTTSNTLDYAFLMMLLHPDVQTKVQQCLDEEIVKDTLLSYADRYKYTNTILLLMQYDFCKSNYLNRKQKFQSREQF